MEYGLLRITIVCLPYFLCGLMEVGCGALRGLGKSWTPLVISTLGACVFRIVWIATVFSSIHTLQCLYLSWPISWLLTLLAHYITFFFSYRRLLRPKQASISEI